MKIKFLSFLAACLLLCTSASHASIITSQTTQNASQSAYAGQSLTTPGGGA